MDSTTNDVRVILCTCPESGAEALARTLVDERLAACVNLLPAVRSVYRWQGQVTTDAEALLVIKSTGARWPALRERLAALHPYELPEIIAVPVTDGLAGYLDWVNDEVAN